MKINKFKHLISDPPKWTKYFLIWTKESYFLQFLLIFSFKKRRHFPLLQAPKMFKAKNLFAHFRVIVTFFLRPCAKLKSNIP